MAYTKELFFCMHVLSNMNAKGQGWKGNEHSSIYRSCKHFMSDALNTKAINNNNHKSIGKQCKNNDMPIFCLINLILLPFLQCAYRFAWSLQKIFHLRGRFIKNEALNAKHSFGISSVRPTVRLGKEIKDIFFSKLMLLFSV